jgi:hypothetical protein
MEEPEPVVEAVIEPVKQEEPVSTFYQYVPTEPVILSPHVEYVDPKQKEIDELKEMVKALMAKLN